MTDRLREIEERLRAAIQKSEPIINQCDCANDVTLYRQAIEAFALMGEAADALTSERARVMEHTRENEEARNTIKIQHEAIINQARKETELRARVVEVEVALGKCRERFQEYGDGHNAKGDLHKAHRNWEMAALCARALKPGEAK